MPTVLQPTDLVAQIILGLFGGLKGAAGGVYLGSALAAGLALGLLLIAAPSWRRQLDEGSGSRPDWAFLALCAAILLVFRLPLLLRPFGFDESGLLATGLTLYFDPRPWLVADCATIGPLCPLFFSAFQALGVPVSFATARLLVLLAFMIPTIICIHGTVRLCAPLFFARLASIAYVVFFIFVDNLNFMTVSAELFGMPIIGMSILLTVHMLAGRGLGDARIFLACALLGLLPFIKLQLAPIGVGIALVLMAFIAATYWRQDKATALRKLALALLGGVATTLAFAAYAVVEKALPLIWGVYIGHNLSYVGERPGSFWQVLLAVGADMFKRSGRQDFLVAIAVFGMVGLVLWRRAGAANTWHRVLLSLTFALSLYCMFLPKRSYPHYLIVAMPTIFMMFGLGAHALWSWAGALTARLAGGGQRGWASQASAALRTVPLVAAAAVLLWGFSAEPGQWWERLAQGDYGFKPDEVTAYITQHSLPRDSLVVFGRDISYYVRASRKQGSRYADVYSYTVATPQAQYIDELCQSIATNRPRIFLDTSLDSSGSSRLSQVPALQEVVERQYQPGLSLGKSRVFLLKDGG